ncbi:hypothetical protein F5Y19DRAFT_621 [Xylariaceae sp. FL1651]|nr:hypothetical protein F5Y19DRAFT_621 [Xylariaceae sp. FL1651]
MAGNTNTLDLANETYPSQPPPAPPLPTSLPEPPSVPPVSTSKTRAYSSELAAKRAKMASQYGLADRPRKTHAPLFSSTTFKPCHMFFYGTLMDPDVLQRITCCPTKPVMRPGWISGFKPKMWSTYPTLIPLDELDSSSAPDPAAVPAQQGQGIPEASSSSIDGAKPDADISEPNVQIRGMFWKVDDYQHFWELQRYETSAYRGYWCQIHADDVENDSGGQEVILEDGVVFVWAKYPKSPDLKDGMFDLAKWQKTHKSSLFQANKF